MKETIEIDIDERAVEAYKDKLNGMLDELDASHPEEMDRFATAALVLAIHLAGLRNDEGRNGAETIATCQMLEDLGAVATQALHVITAVHRLRTLLAADLPTQMQA